MAKTGDGGRKDPHSRYAREKKIGVECSAVRSSASAFRKWNHSCRPTLGMVNKAGLTDYCNAYVSAMYLEALTYGHVIRWVFVPRLSRHLFEYQSPKWDAKTRTQNVSKCVLYRIDHLVWLITDEHNLLHPFYYFRMLNRVLDFYDIHLPLCSLSSPKYQLDRERPMRLSVKSFLCIIYNLSSRKDDQIEAA